MNILITGGASGLGEAVTKMLAQNSSHNVFFTYFRAKENAGLIEEQFKNAKGIQVDFRNPEDISQLVNSISENDIDVLINNAISGHIVNHFQKLDPEYFLQSFSMNIAPTLKITQAAIKWFRKKKFGKIITVLTSGLISNPPIGWSEYTANKAYLHSMAKSWATENSAYNITSNCISPSFLQTGLNSEMDERFLGMTIDSHPLKKLLTVEEVAEAIDYLCNTSQQLNGINLIMNSGVNML